MGTFSLFPTPSPSFPFQLPIKKKSTPEDRHLSLQRLRDLHTQEPKLGYPTEPPWPLVIEKDPLPISSRIRKIMSGERLLPHSSPPMEEGFGRSPMIQMQTKRKGIGTRTWLIVSESGHSHTEEVEKHSIMRRTGLHARDLRVLDPVLSYPSTILGRERAIFVNLEHIKAIITAAEVLMINSNSPLMVQFVQDIQHRVSAPSFVPQQVFPIGYWCFSVESSNCSISHDGEMW